MCSILFFCWRLLTGSEALLSSVLRSYDGDSEDAPSHSSCSFNDCSLGDVNCNVPLHALTSRSPGEVSPEDPLSPNIPVLVLPAAGWDPASLEASDVGLQPVGTSSLEAQRRAARLPRPPADSRMMEEDRAPPRLADTHRAEPECPGRHPGSGLRTGGPKLSFSKRKLELLLAEPERNKKKKQYGA